MSYFEHTEGHILIQHCPEKIIIETGTCLGRTVEFVLEHGAKSVRSVEGDRDRYESCAKRFADDSRVSLWCGHSKDYLREMIKDLHETAVFFLDAHPSGGDSFGHNEIMGEDRDHNLTIYGQDAVLMAELQIIAEHPIKNHTILLDDQHSIDGTNERKYKEFLLTHVNPNYTFEFIPKIDSPDGGCLVAQVIA